MSRKLNSNFHRTTKSSWVFLGHSASFRLQEGQKVGHGSSHWCAPKISNQCAFLGRPVRCSYPKANPCPHSVVYQDCRGLQLCSFQAPWRMDKEHCTMLCAHHVISTEMLDLKKKKVLSTAINSKWL